MNKRGDKPDSTGGVVHWSSVLTSADLDKSITLAEGYNRKKLPRESIPRCSASTL
jgi:hypothetical protein